MSSWPSEDVSDVLAAAIKLEPDWRALHVPLPLSRLIRRCLDKDPKKRRRDIGDVWNELGTIGDGESEATATVGANTHRPRQMAVGALLIVAGIALGLWSGGGDDTVVTEHDERSPAFSPDGRFLAYVSDESGVDEVYVSAFPAGRRWTISNGIGTEPVWSPRGDELFYRRDRAVMAVNVQRGDDLNPGLPTLVFDGPYSQAPYPSGTQSYDVSPDGTRFLMTELRGVDTIDVLTNPLAGLSDE